MFHSQLNVLKRFCMLYACEFLMYLLDLLNNLHKLLLDCF